MSCKVVAKTKTEDLAKNLIIKLGIALALKKANFVSRNIGLNQPFAVVPALHSVLFCFVHLVLSYSAHERWHQH